MQGQGGNYAKAPDYPSMPNDNIGESAPYQPAGFNQPNNNN